MNRKIFVLVILFALVFVSTGICEESKIRWGQVDTYEQLKHNLPRNMFQMGLSRGGTSTVVTGTIAIPLGYSVVKIVCATSSKTLANGFSGQILTMVAIDQTGTVTITPATATGWASASMDAVGEVLTVQYVDDTLGWIIVGISGTTITGINSN